ncbi:hypothetical protein ACFL1H_03750 [Nanoarchaeota archaeon]
MEKNLKQVLMGLTGIGLTCLIGYGLISLGRQTAEFQGFDHVAAKDVIYTCNNFHHGSDKLVSSSDTYGKDFDKDNLNDEHVICMDGTIYANLTSKNSRDYFDEKHDIFYRIKVE